MTCRLFVEPGSLAAGPRMITGEAYHYLVRVRRMRAGDGVDLFDGQGREAVAVVGSIAADHAVLEVAAPRLVDAAPRSSITVAQALIKGERMDWCIQKLVELGVRAIIPLATERAVVRLDRERARKRQERFVEIARDAARQSRRATVPAIHPVTTLDELGPLVADCDLKLALWENETSTSLHTLLTREPPGRVCLLVGPEGGFTSEEIERVVAAGFTTVGLGPYILRAETAAVAAAAVLGIAFGDLRG